MKLLGRACTLLGAYGWLTRTKRVLWIAAIGGLVTAIVACFTRDLSSVGYHLSRLKSTQRLLRYVHCRSKFFTREALNWNLHGRRTIRELEIEQEVHEAALVRLGHFERREFRFRNRTPTPQTPWLFSTMVYTGACPMSSSFQWSTTNSVLVVTALPSDMKNWDSRVAQFDTK